MQLDTPGKKTSYSIGLDMGINLLRLPVDIDVAAVVRGIEDAYQRKEPLISREEFTAVMEEFQRKLQEAQESNRTQVRDANLQAGASFCEANAKKSGVVSTPSGLQYESLQEGTGPSPSASSAVRVHYRGTFISGEEFDSSYARGEPTEFPLNRVIRGWTEGIQKMRVGGKARLVIPASLAYGDGGTGPIPPGATLVFDVELLGIIG